MIYVDTSQDPGTLYFPRNGYGVGHLWALHLRNTTDGREVAVPVLARPSLAGFLVAVKPQRFPEGFGPGEWQYSLVLDGKEAATGLLSAYDGNKEGAVQYDEDINAIQYDG